MSESETEAEVVEQIEEEKEPVQRNLFDLSVVPDDETVGICSFLCFFLFSLLFFLFLPFFPLLFFLQNRLLFILFKCLCVIRVSVTFHRISVVLNFVQNIRD